MPGTKQIPDPEVDHGLQGPPPNPWKPPNPADPAVPWVEIPLDASGYPNWPADVPGGYPNGPWDPMNPKPGPHGRKITFNPKAPKTGGTQALLRIHCGGGDYEIPWGDLCNPDTPKAVAIPTGSCDNSPPVTSVTVVPKSHKYISELECSVQITCVVVFTITTQRWKCQGFKWITDGQANIDQKYTEKSYIFQCC
jgi:hypothetical protein